MREKTTKKFRKMRLAAMFLAIILLVSNQGLISMAQTVSENQGMTVSGNVVQAGTQNTVPEGTPSNPVHDCINDRDVTDLDTSDTTTWSYVYFGSYPQTEIFSTEIILKIEKAIEAGEGSTEDIGIDVWVDGRKYRRIASSDTSYTNAQGYFGDAKY